MPRPASTGCCSTASTGRADLAAALGHRGHPGDPAVQSVIADAIARICAAGKPAGILATEKSLAILERHLAGAEWLACGRATIADVAVFPYVALAPMGDIGLEPYPAVEAWIARFRALPGFIPIAGLDDPRYRR